MKFTIAGNGDLAAPCVTYFFRSPQNYAFDQLNAADLQPSTDAQKRILFSELIYIYICVCISVCICVCIRGEQRDVEASVRLWFLRFPRE